MAEEVTDPLQGLISCIKHLHDLLCNLPSSLHLNPDGANIADRDGILSEDEQDQEVDDIEDDMGVPLPLVVECVLHVRVQDTSGHWLAKVGIYADGEAQLSAGDAEEDI
ncbi:hypothetical protein B0H14DRAFT_2586791 [Mycena olivaceomarginata]|nr:hypothetical protein B0H14DRAFT_2586791 [Mycena olivaceomarginata]